MDKKLVLHRETIVQLEDRELANVAGGDHTVVIAFSAGANESGDPDELGIYHFACPFV
jgi:hypothetical protein